MESEGVNNKRIAKNTLFLYLRMLFIMTVSLFTVRIIYNNLGIEDYGLYGAIGGVVISLSFISTVLSNAAQRFFSVELGRNAPQSINRVFYTLLFTYILAAILVLLIGETLGVWFVNNIMTIPDNRLLACNIVFQFALFSFILSIVENPFQALVISKEDMKWYAYIGIFSVLLKLFVAIIITVIPYDRLISYSSLLSLSFILEFVIYVVLCHHNYPEIKKYSKINKSIFKDIFSYSSWTMFGCITSVVNTQGINMLLNIFNGPTANAAYSVGNQVSNTTNTFAGSFYTAVRPPMIKAYSSKDMDSVNKLFYLSNKILFSLLFLIILPVFIEAENLLRLWLGNVGPFMVDFVRLMLVYVLIVSMSSPITTIIQAAGYVKAYHGIVDTITLITLPISFVLLKIGGDISIPFYVSIIVFIIAHTIRLAILKKVYDYSIIDYIRRIVLPIIFIILSGYVLYYIRGQIMGNNLISSIIVIFTAIITVSIESYLILLNKDERKKIWLLMKNKM